MRRPTPSWNEAIAAVASGKFAPCLVKESDGWHARWRGTDAADNPHIDEIVRTASVTPLSARAEFDIHPTVHDAWLAALKSETGLVRRDDGECARFAEVLERWLSEGVDSPEAKRAIPFSLRQEKNKSFVACPVPHGEKEYRALGRATSIFGPLRSLALSKDGKTLSVELDREEAEEFMRHAASALANAGYVVSAAGEDAEVVVSAVLSDAPRGEVTAKTALLLNGERISAAELRVLLEQKKEYVFFNGHWVKLDRPALLEALELAERAKMRRFTVREALGFAALLSSAGGTVDANGAIGKTMNAIAHGKAADISGIDCAPPGFNGKLRDYQARAVSWMRFMSGLGFGVLLADDMGLGKTIEAIAWILASRAKAGKEGATAKPHLVIAPLTLLSNWRRELSRFAPSLEVFVHHGPERPLESRFAHIASHADVVVTSYGIFTKDREFIAAAEWSGVVIDEAQAIKNPDTATARAVKTLKTGSRLALTGTPVENSALDIWSIEEFLNRGFLGDRRRFDETFAKPISENPASHATARLKRLLEPFVLRRLKTDPAIAAEIGGKRTTKEYCTLSGRQKAAYEDALDAYRRGERRKGDAFALLTRLKLICDGEGKMARLFDLLESIFAAGESALVFTQYAKVGAAVSAALAKRFGRRFPFLHGALSTKEREREISAFESPGPNAFVLSLRAGAFGLNLVKATHVIHFDRWWNPAVENQATDRAHRIGQRKTVFVHTFITEGTLEEKVDNLLEKKTRLSGGVVGSGESFLLKMSLGEIESLAALN